MNSRFEKTS